MYFGVLAVGADVAAGMPVFYFAKQGFLKFSLSFFSMKEQKNGEVEVKVFNLTGELVASFKMGLSLKVQG
jgi:hypothetical protein